MTVLSSLHLGDIKGLEFKPEPPSVLKVSAELFQALSWLTAATKKDRRLVSCDDEGALLTSPGWSLLVSVETDELYPQTGVPDLWTFTKANKAVLIASSTILVKISLLRVSGGTAEHFYLPPGALFYFPHPVYSVTATTVPAATGAASYVGITALN